MGRPKLDLIKPLLGVARTSDGDLIQRLNAVHNGMFNNPEYPNPPVDMTAFKAGIDAFTAAAAAALDGGKSIFAERNRRRADVVIMFRQLGHYVEVACNNDMAAFLTSGFAVSMMGQRTPRQPVSTPAIAAVKRGISGQLFVVIRPVAKALYYDLRYGRVPADASPVEWINIMLASTRPTPRFSDLTPGGTYTFQVRAFGKLGFSDWSSPAELICF